MAEGSKSDMSLKAIGEDSRIKLGFAIATLFAAGWWAANLQGKVDSLLLATQGQRVQAEEIRNEIRQIDKRVLILEMKKP